MSLSPSVSLCLLLNASRCTAEISCMYASIVSKSPSKVLDSEALDAWENDFTRLQSEYALVSPVNPPSVTEQNDGCEAIGQIGDQRLMMKIESSASSYSSSTGLRSDEKCGDSTFCFQCFSHSCRCSADISSSSVEAAVGVDNVKEPCSCCETTDGEYATNSSSCVSSSSTFQLEYIDEVVESPLEIVANALCKNQQHSIDASTPDFADTDAEPTTIEQPSQTIGLEKHEAVEVELSSSTNDDYSYTPDSLESEESVSAGMAKAPKPKDYSIPHQYLRNSAFISLVPSTETIVNLLPKVNPAYTVKNFSFDEKDEVPNPPRSANDLYSPRWLRGKGARKEGLCPLCEPVDPSSPTSNMWLKTKTSRFWYHMNFYHGISSVNGRPYSPPIALRAVEKNITPHKNQLGIVHQGYCGQCGHWVDLQGKQPLLVPELKWWKHTQKCHVLGERYQIANKAVLERPSITISLPR